MIHVRIREENNYRCDDNMKKILASLTDAVTTLKDIIINKNAARVALEECIAPPRYHDRQSREQ